MATKISVYQTRDKQNFDNPIDADLHETVLDLTGALINKGIINDGNLRRVCSELAQHYDSFEPLLAKLKALNLKKKKQKK